MTDEEMSILDAALARIVPADDDPGALAAGVGEVVRERSSRHRDQYRTAAILLGSRGFVSLAPEEQDAVLGELEAHPAVSLLIAHATEAFYTSEAGFQTVGFRVTA